MVNNICIYENTRKATKYCEMRFKMQIVSAVRDFEMYDRLVKNNMFNKGAEFTAIDNTVENKYISVRYNEFLDNYDYTKPDWIMFCHEDWELKENLDERLARLDKYNLYGPIGRSWLRLQGQIVHSDRFDNAETIGHFCKDIALTTTFDCQCMIVHSDLIKQYNLRFDEKLYFDLYVEDFCINAKELFGVKSYILQMDCQHYSKGSVAQRFYDNFNYLSEKYNRAKYSYFTTVLENRPIGNKYTGKLSVALRKFITFVYWNRITTSNKRLIKICKIPIYSRRLK